MTLLDFFRGYGKFKVKTKKPERLLDELRRVMPLRNTKIPSEGILEFSLYFCDRKKAVEISEKHGEIIFVKYVGASYFLFKYKRRYGLFLGAFLFFALVFLSTFFVWDIDVEGNQTVPENEIVKTLYDVGFSTGAFKKKVDIDSIVNRYLIAEDRVSFIAINFDGSVARVQIKEADIPKSQERKENVNIVADRDGIIMRVDALSGKSEVTKGETVTKGQLLIGAFVDKRTGGSILKGAKGYVFAETSRRIDVYVPIFYGCKMYKSEKTKGVSAKILSGEVNFINPFLGSKGIREEVKEEIHFKENINLPFRLYKRTSREYEEYLSRRSESTALETARREAKRRLFESGENINVISVEETSIAEGDMLYYSVVFVTVENIAVEKEFELS